MRCPKSTGYKCVWRTAGDRCASSWASRSPKRPCRAWTTRCSWCHRYDTMTYSVERGAAGRAVDAARGHWRCSTGGGVALLVHWRALVAGVRATSAGVECKESKWLCPCTPKIDFHKLAACLVTSSGTAPMSLICWTISRPSGAIQDGMKSDHYRYIIEDGLGAGPSPLARQPQDRLVLLDAPAARTSINSKASIISSRSHGGSTLTQMYRTV